MTNDASNTIVSFENATKAERLEAINELLNEKEIEFFYHEKPSKPNDDRKNC